MNSPFIENSFYVLDSWSIVNVTGDDATKFINGFCTNDIQKLASGNSCEAFFTDVKAHILAYTYVYKHSDTSLTLIVTSSLADELLNHLDRYLIREDVELSVGNHALIFVAGESINVPNSLKIHLEGGGEIHFLEEGSLEAAIEALVSQDYQSMSVTDFDRGRILSGQILFDDIDVDSDNLPQEVNRIEQTISFSKGCYLGQEPVARIDALGQVNWLLRRLASPKGTLKPGENISQDGKVVAKVKSVVSQNDGSEIALAYVRRQLADEGTEIICSDNKVTVNLFKTK